MPSLLPSTPSPPRTALAGSLLRDCAPKCVDCYSVLLPCVGRTAHAIYHLERFHHIDPVIIRTIGSVRVGVIQGDVVILCKIFFPSGADILFHLILICIAEEGARGGSCQREISSPTPLVRKRRITSGSSSRSCLQVKDTDDVPWGREAKPTGVTVSMTL